MDNKIVNKQITVDTIVKVADYLEKYKEDYDKKFKIDEEKNKDVPFGEKKWEYENGNVYIKYTIEFQNGKTLTEKDYNWFIQNTNQTDIIKKIEIHFYVSYYDENREHNKISVETEFRDCGMDLKYSEARIYVDATSQENLASNMYYEVYDIINDNEDRYNRTIKYKKLRIQSFNIAVGIILSYILYIVLKVNIDKLPSIISENLNNKYVLVFGQWLIAFALGNILASWYIVSIYNPILPEMKYAGYNKSNYKSIYKDNIDDYVEHCEIHIGKFWDAQKRRNKIETIYKITNKIILAQLLISAILFFVLK